MSKEGSPKPDRLVKNTIRDRYKAETGIDPVLNYPIKVALKGRQEND